MYFDVFLKKYFKAFLFYINYISFWQGLYKDYVTVLHTTSSMQQPVWPFPANLFHSLQIYNDTHTHTHTHTQESTQAGVSPALRDPRCRPVAACLKPNHLYTEREIAQGVCVLQAGPGPSQPQPNSSGVFDGSYADQKSERRHWSEVSLKGEHPTGGFTSFSNYFRAEDTETGLRGKKQCVQKQR